MQQALNESPNGSKSAFAFYLTGSSLWMVGMSLQGFLFTWLLVGVLETPAIETGYARFIAELPPLAVLLVGGMLGDRSNGRTYLMIMHSLMAIPPLIVAVVFELGMLSYWWVVLFAVSMASIQSLSDPARQAVLSRVTPMHIQRAVTVMTIVTTGVGTVGFYLGGRLEDGGLSLVLCLQTLCFLTGILAVKRLPTLPASQQHRASFAQGLKATFDIPLIRNIIGLNFLSSLFNAGAYIIAIPYIVTEVYQGDAGFFANVMIIFTAGSIGSNVLLYLFMPLRHPGRLFVFMQLTRIVILGLLVVKPSLPVFYLLMFAWGLNMGVTTTIVRSTVQELAPPAQRAQILSILLLSFMVSSPISSILLGYVISGFTPLAALVPGMFMSAIIFVIAITVSGLWHYDSTTSAQTSPG